MKDSFNIMNLIKCPYEWLPKDNPDTYVIRPQPLKGTLFVTFENLEMVTVTVQGTVEPLCCWFSEAKEISVKIMVLTIPICKAETFILSKFICSE